jgi:hypothetical protein
MSVFLNDSHWSGCLLKPRVPAFLGKILVWLSISGFGVCWVFVGCSTPVPTHWQLSSEDRARQSAQFSSELVEQFQSKIRLTRDVAVVSYLQNLANDRLLPYAKKLQLQKQPVLVGLVARDAQIRWKSYGLLGNRIYLSLEVLSRLSYESEVAALLAFELSHLEQRDLISQLEQIDGGALQVGSERFSNSVRRNEILSQLDYAGDLGVFSFSDAAHLAAVEGAAHLLYQTGYDARGFVSLLELYQNHLPFSPFSARLLSQMIQTVRKELVQQSPLRNPIVRTEAFLQIQKRMKEL